MILEIANAFDQLTKNDPNIRKENWSPMSPQYNAWMLPSEYNLKAKLKDAIYLNSLSIRHLYKFESKLASLAALQENWDGYNGLIPTEQIISRTKCFLGIVPISYLNVLDEESIYPNSHGTITIEWRQNETEVISVEIGNTTANYYAIINGNIYKSDFVNDIETQFPETLKSLLNQLFRNSEQYSFNC